MITTAMATAGIPNVGIDVHLGALPAICFAVGTGIVVLAALLDLRDRRRSRRRPLVGVTSSTAAASRLGLAV